MSSFDNILTSLRHQGFWGPFLVLVGVVACDQSLRFVNLVEPRPFDYAVFGAGFLVVIAGVALMFKQFTANTESVASAPPAEGQEDANYVVQQLHRNFEILRAQTNQGFLLSGLFMAVGLILIVTSLFAPSFGLKTEGITNLGVLAGVVTEFISGTALVLYKANFSRLNETSDRLDDAWRALAAFKLTRELPDDKKAEATLQLISALTKVKG